MIKIGVIGYGYWGPNLVRNFFELDNCKILKVTDTRRDRLVLLKKNYPSIGLTERSEDIFDDHTIDAIVIATPISTHYHLAKKALLGGKHVLVEKPLTSSLSQAQVLVDLAKRKKKVLMVDHTFLYTDAVQKIKTFIDKGDIGKINYFDSIRTNLGLFQQDVNVLWDLTAHDISILLYLSKEKPVSVQASGVSHTKNRIENMAFVTLKYQSGFIAHLNASWSSPVKIRTILIGGSKKMIVYNDIEPTEKVKLYDSGYKIKQTLDKNKLVVDYRIGDVNLPKIDLHEGLSLVARDFINAIENGKKPLSDMNHGRDVVKILSLAQESLRNGEKPVKYESTI